MPPVTLVDTRNDRRIRSGVAIGRGLETFLKQALNDGGQAILFLNLRGHSPAVWCRACGQGMRCGACDVTLTWHRDRRAVVCHICDFEAQPPRECPGCGQVGLKLLGVGTQKLEEEVRKRFPEAKVLRMDSDSMRRPGSHDRALEQFRSGEAQILLGTQMIAKGHDFEAGTLVGVISADVGLGLADFRAAERTFQLLTQVAGRAGRGDTGGEAVYQTFFPEHYSIGFACRQSYEPFFESEMHYRRSMRYPPVVSLSLIHISEPTSRRGLSEGVVGV